MEQETIKDRLTAFIAHIGSNNSQFEKSLGFANSFVANISKGVSSEKLEKILTEYPSLNLLWLITGRGPMLNPEPTNPDAESEVSETEKNATDLLFAQYRADHEFLKSQLAELTAQNRLLVEQLRDQEARLKAAEAGK